MKLETTSCFKTLSKIKPGMKVLSPDEIKQIQAISLEALQDIRQVCDRLDISWHLTGGSALGAVRHSGFIPWDDDLDIDMSRRDIDRFFAEFEKCYGDKYWIHTPYSESRFCMPARQIRRRGTVFQTCSDPEALECGIAVDIPVIENVPDSALLRKLHGFGSLALGLIVSCRRFYMNRAYMLQLAEGVPEVEKIFRTKIRLGRLFAFLPLRSWTILNDRWNAMCKNSSSRYVSVPAGRKHYFGELYERSAFEDYTETDFEGIRAKIPKEYDSYLKHMYGNYMQLPKEEDREQHVLMKFEINI